MNKNSLIKNISNINCFIPNVTKQCICKTQPTIAWADETRVAIIGAAGVGDHVTELKQVSILVDVATDAVGQGGEGVVLVCELWIHVYYLRCSTVRDSWCS